LLDSEELELLDSELFETELLSEILELFELLDSELVETETLSELELLAVSNIPSAASTNKVPLLIYKVLPVSYTHLTLPTSDLV